MQVIKKRNTIEPFNKEQGSGIVNYDGIIGDIFDGKPGMGNYASEHPFDTYATGSNPVLNPYNLSYTITPSISYNTLKEKVVSWQYDMDIPVKHNGIMCIGISIQHWWNIISQKFTGFYALAFNSKNQQCSFCYGTHDNMGQEHLRTTSWSICTEGENYRLSVILEGEINNTSLDTTTPPYTSDQFIYDGDGYDFGVRFRTQFTIGYHA